MDYPIILQDVCYNCKYYNIPGNMYLEGYCHYLNIHCYQDFICDFYKRKNSGAYRRKRRKVKKEYDSKNMG